MVDEKFRKALEAFVVENEIQETHGKVIVLDSHAYDKSVVGVTDNGILVYDYSKMVAEYMEDEHCTEEEALEWLEYNTLRALPDMGKRRPIIVYDSKESIVDFYGEEDTQTEEKK